MSFFLVAITLGFLGSFHCVGMCGPIALALPVHHEKTLKKILLIISYNAGRILTYAVFGLAGGLLGQGFFAAGLQQFLSVTVGSLLLLGVILPLLDKKLFQVQTPFFRWMNALKSALSKQFMKKGYRPLFLVGLLNGLLPCGLVYMGLAGSIATGDILLGAAFMAIFGLGTLPAMVVIPLLGNFINVNFRNRIRKTVPLFITITATLLILRGLNLGIPYVSPKITNGEAASCHSSQVQPSLKNNILCSGHVSLPKK